MALASGRRAQQVEERPLRGVGRRVEVVAAVQHQRRHADPRRVVHGVVLRRLVAPDPRPLQHAGLQAGLERGQDRPRIGPGADAVEADARRVDVRTRFEIVDAASELPRPGDAAFAAGVRREGFVGRALVGPFVHRVEQRPAAADDESHLAERQVAARPELEGIVGREEDDRLIRRRPSSRQEEVHAQPSTARWAVDGGGEPGSRRRCVRWLRRRR